MPKEKKNMVKLPRLDKIINRWGLRIEKVVIAMVYIISAGLIVGGIIEFLLNGNIQLSILGAGLLTALRYSKK